MAEGGLSWDGRVNIRDLGGLPVAPSEAKWAPSVGAWIAEEALERRHGSARDYLGGGEAEEAALDRLAGRLRG